MATQLTRYQQGLGSVNADGLNTFVQGCDTYADLRGFIGQDQMQVYVRGAEAVNDGYQGSFYWDSSSTATDNGFSIIEPNGVTQGAWLRLSQDAGPWLAASTSYANDAAAAAGGVPIGGIYRNGSLMSIRVA